MLAFVSLRSLRLAAGLILLGGVGAIVAFGLSSAPRPSATSSSRSATTRPSTARPPPKSFQTAPLETSPRRGVDRIEGPYGRGGGEVWVVVPDRPVQSVVVFGHGWKLAPPSTAYSWVGQFRPWLDHLAADGSAVIFPRYQLGVGDPRTQRAYSISPPGSIPATRCWDDRRSQLWRSATPSVQASRSTTARTRPRGDFRSPAQCKPSSRAG